MPSPTLSVVPSEVDDPVPAALRAVIELFSTELAKVAFPDVDVASLKRQADELRTAAKAVARARQALDAAVASLATHTQVLAQTAARGVAYATIYADAHPEREALVTALAAMTEPKPTPSQSSMTVGKRRGRPRRQSAELFDAGVTSTDS